MLLTSIAAASYLLFADFSFVLGVMVTGRYTHSLSLSWLMLLHYR